MTIRKTSSTNLSHRSRYESAMLSLSLAIVFELAAIAAVLTLILVTATEASVADAILATTCGYVIPMIVGSAVLRRYLRRNRSIRQ